MKRSEIDSDLPLLEFYLDETRTTRAHRRVSREAVLRTFIRTRDYGETARATGGSLTLVRWIVMKAVFMARRLAGLTPVLLPHEEQD